MNHTCTSEVFLDGDQPYTRPLPTLNNTSAEETQTYVHAWNGIRKNDPNIRQSKSALFHRLHGHRDRLINGLLFFHLKDRDVARSKTEGIVLILILDVRYPVSHYDGNMYIYAYHDKSLGRSFHLILLCGLVVRVPDYIKEMYCDSCEVRTEFIYVM
jgi:hypothetical protein